MDLANSKYGMEIKQRGMNHAETTRNAITTGDQSSIGED
jgi:hypothetical protein